MKEAVSKQARKVGDFSNGNIKKNANTLLEMKPANKYIQWVGGNACLKVDFFFFFFFFCIVYKKMKILIEVWAPFSYLSRWMI